MHEWFIVAHRALSVQIIYIVLNVIVRVPSNIQTAVNKSTLIQACTKWKQIGVPDPQVLCTRKMGGALA